MGIDTNTVCRWVRDYRRKNHLPSYAENKGIKQATTKVDKEMSKQLKARDKRITELAKRAMTNALVNRKPNGRLIFHSDRGCQYSSKGYLEYLEKHNVESSMGRKGNPYDNACSESFFIILKKECGDGENTWEYARYIYNLMRHYFSNGVNGCVYWNMILEPGGESTWGWKQNSMITKNPDSGKVVYNPEF